MTEVGTKSYVHKKFRALDKMVNKEEHQQVHTIYQNDDSDGSDSSNHDTDPNSDSSLNLSPDSNYNDASAELLHAFKGDDRGVFLWKFAVKVMMIFVAILLTTMTYVQLSQSEKHDFKASVRGVFCTFLVCLMM